MQNRYTNNMKKVILIALTVVGLMGCGDAGTEPTQRGKYVERNVQYSKDPRTNLCFAMVFPHGFTNVPCTKEVEELISK